MFTSILYPYLKPILFRLDPEKAHELTSHLLIYANRLGMIHANNIPSCKEKTIAGLHFKNSLGLAAGMDKTAQAASAWANLGFGCVEVGTLTPKPQAGNPKPRLFRLPKHQALINRMGFNNPGIHSAVDAIKRQKINAIVGINIGKNFNTPNEKAADDYIACLKICHQTADYVTINISSPNTKGLRDLQAEDTIKSLLYSIIVEQEKLESINHKKVPLFLKIAPDLDDTQINAICRVCNDLQIDGVITTNTTLAREGVSSDPLAQENGGLSGAPVLVKSNEVLKKVKAQLNSNVALIGVGGITHGEHAVDKMKAGANLVQLYSGLIYQGPGLIQEVLHHIAQHEQTI
jgi:dihydroorotate dehydrogenase